MIGAIHPTTDPVSKPYWEWLKEKDFRLQKCDGCGEFRFPPYENCPYCGGKGGEWLPLSGRGKVYSWFVGNVTPDPRYKEDIPYIVVLVELEDGPRIVSRLVNCSPDEVKGDMPVIGRYHEVDQDLTLLTFEPERIA